MSVSKSDKKLIQKAIKGLPEMQSRSRMETRFLMVKPGHYVKRVVPAIANHKTNAEKIFAQDGIAGVEKYCADVKERYRLYHEQQDSAPSIN